MSDNDKYPCWIREKFKAGLDDEIKLIGGKKLFSFLKIGILIFKLFNVATVSKDPDRKVTTNQISRDRI